MWNRAYMEATGSYTNVGEKARERAQFTIVILQRDDTNGLQRYDAS